MAERKIKNRKIPSKVLKRAKLLHLRGETFAQIGRKLGISAMSLSRYSRDEAWEEEVVPAFTVTEMVQDLRHLLFAYLQEAVLGELEEDMTRITLNIKSMVNALKELEDLSVHLAARDGILAAEQIMQWTADRYADFPHLPEFLTILQTYHDEQLNALQD